jgi:hypothetical protein
MRDTERQKVESTSTIEKTVPVVRASSEIRTQSFSVGGIAGIVLGLLLLIAGAIEWSSAGSQVRRAFGQGDPIAILLFILGSLAVVLGFFLGFSLLSITRTNDPSATVEDRLRRLDDLRSEGLIAESEYQQRRAEIVASL